MKICPHRSSEQTASGIVSCCRGEPARAGQGAEIDHALVRRAANAETSGTMASGHADSNLMIPNILHFIDEAWEVAKGVRNISRQSNGTLMKLGAILRAVLTVEESIKAIKLGFYSNEDRMQNLTCLPRGPCQRGAVGRRSGLVRHGAERLLRQARLTLPVGSNLFALPR